MKNRISFILVEPAVPENVGAIARAMKTMGFNDLVLVNPCDYLSKPGTSCYVIRMGIIKALTIT